VRVIQQHSGKFGIPATSTQFAQTCFKLLPVQRHKRESIAMTNSFFVLLF